jgi:energy-converting hydrogenase Eha subunit A
MLWILLVALGGLVTGAWGMYIALHEMQRESPMRVSLIECVERYGPTPLASLGITVVPKETTPPEEDR